MSKNSKKKDRFAGLLTEKQQEELQNMVEGMFDVASDLAKEYGELDISELNELSSSITQISQESPFLDEIFKGDSWKKVMKKHDKFKDEEDAD
jgi:predicted nuclease with TOPRIM domain